jgi:hypothetical protein
MKTTDSGAKRRKAAACLALRPEPPTGGRRTRIHYPPPPPEITENTEAKTGFAAAFPQIFVFAIFYAFPGNLAAPLERLGTKNHNTRSLPVIPIPCEAWDFVYKTLRETRPEIPGKCFRARRCESIF